MTAETLGRYHLIRKIATGGMAEVFLASAEGPGGFSKQLVVKRILPHHADNPQFVQMFLSEAKLAAQLNHPNVVQVFDFGQAGKDYYLAMEFIDGLNLRSLNRMHRVLQGPIPFALGARIISHACEGLAYAHGFKDAATGRLVNLVHRDISPDNIVVSKHGAVKVLDFGIAKSEQQSHKTATGMLKGKMAYMPQEQLQREPLDLRVDVYALGVVMFELLAGSLPFDATSEVSIIQAVMKPDPLPALSDLVRDIPPQLEEIVARALAKHKGARYPDCLALQEDLEAFIASTGEKCLPSDLSKMVENCEAAHTEPTNKEMPAPVMPKKPASIVPTLVGDDGKPITGVSNTMLRRVTGEQPIAGGASEGAPVGVIVAALLLIVAAAGLSAYVLMGKTSETATPVTPVVVPLPPAKAAVAGAVDSGAVAEVDAGAAEVVAVEPPPVRDPAPKHAVKKGEVEVRIRPYAVLFVDGKKVGQTPLEEPLSLPAGKHTFRMVNEQYKKDVSVEFNVKPGKSVFKHNLNE